MLFKTTAIATEYLGLHPEVRRVLGDLDEQVRSWGLEQITITEVLRTPKQQEELYWKKYWSPSVAEPEARTQARARFSWHLVGCAADVRNTIYTPAELKRICRWLTSICQKPKWLILAHDVGRGYHLHVERQDRAWRARYESAVRGVS